MTVTPSGMISLPVGRMRTMLARSAAFRTWTGTADETAALARIHAFTFNSDNDTFPLAMVDIGAIDRERNVITNGIRFESTGNSSVRVYLSEQVAADAIEPDAGYTFANTVGAIIDEAEKQAGAKDTLHITRTTMIAGPARVALDDRPQVGDYYEAVFEFQYSRCV
jgi:CO dehydrogenase/acetyl-CoA synthase alpha subunit